MEITVYMMWSGIKHLILCAIKRDCSYRISQNIMKLKMSLLKNSKCGPFLRHPILRTWIKVRNVQNLQFLQRHIKYFINIFLFEPLSILLVNRSYASFSIIFCYFINYKIKNVFIFSETYFYLKSEFRPISVTFAATNSVLIYYKKIGHVK